MDHILEKQPTTASTSLERAEERPPSSHLPGLARASFMTLPSELLTEICTNLCWYLHAEDDGSSDVAIRAREGQCALARLSRTCRLMREIVRPLLFGRVYASRTSDLYLLVRALVGRAELGSTVTEVVVTTPHQAGEMAYSQQIAGIVHGTAGDRFAALASLLLHSAPNLTSASFHLLGPPSLVIEQALKRWNTSAVQHLTRLRLRRLTLRAFDRDHQFVLDQAVYLLRAFRGLSGRAPIPNPPRLPNLTELILTDCGVARRGLANLAHALGDRLARVTVRKDGRRGRGWGPGPAGGAGGAAPEFTIASLELEEILEALRPRWAGTLRELTYHVPRALRLFPAPAPESLAHFGALELLELSTDAVEFDELRRRPGVFASWLPPSLRELRIRGPAVLVSSLRGLLDAVLDGRLPCLARIEITDQACASSASPASPPSPDEVREFRETVAGLRSRGVHVIIHPQDPEPEPED
ncbi:hypothetical protein MYCTH_2129155 [Thermothelomyces thermophilus ATCC 42464]|uniref:F-box domain-containing protein n=1 Tax=Thermothelomyces thermophilus (strain ATCC 42464 / BCRC 31852 / DSM 1799) TaxID=573729 RepID=G2QKF5_THET4|nr:uncharacterized protein MYCTH_2129155 [Thermothelomyces thermophilus ATCC 42464]AEO60061.1 hypothetical protein MYCTH_2129155 [Thermothelomyces thermophilus ATCC 42464]